MSREMNSFWNQKLQVSVCAHLFFEMCEVAVKPLNWRGTWLEIAEVLLEADWKKSGRCMRYTRVVRFYLIVTSLISQLYEIK